MLGAIIGDYCGSTYEFNNVSLNTKKEDIDLLPKGSHFTDDTYMTFSIADSTINNKDIAKNLKAFYRIYPDSDYGTSFKEWCESSESFPYNSYGNGSAMRVSSIGWLYNNILDVIETAIKTAEVTHNHPEGLKGAEVVALSIYMSRDGRTKEQIKEYLTLKYPSYNLNRTLEEIRPTYKFNESCQNTVPEALICFLESDSFVDALRNALWLGGDTDTLACITCSIAEAYYKDIPDFLIHEIFSKLPRHLLGLYAQFLTFVRSIAVTPI